MDDISQCEEAAKQLNQNFEIMEEKADWPSGCHFADQTLPNGDNNYDVNNCPGGHDVFRYQGGNILFFHGAIFTHKNY